MEPPGADGGAQPLFGAGDVGEPAARAPRPPAAARLYDTAESAAADLRPVFIAAQRVAGDLPALSDQQLARAVCAAGHADPAHHARQGHSPRREETTTVKCAASRRRHELQKLAGGE